MGKLIKELLDIANRENWTEYTLLTVLASTLEDLELSDKVLAEVDKWTS